MHKAGALPFDFTIFGNSAMKSVPECGSPPCPLARVVANAERNRQMEASMSSRRLRSRSFFKRHHRLIPVIGTVIVFFTFIIREELGDSWKATAAAIDHAQELYEDRVETQAIQQTVDEEQRTLSRIDLKLRGSQQSVLYDLTGLGEQILKDVGQTLTETESLLNRLEDPPDERKQLVHFKEELQNGLRQGSRLTHEIHARKPDQDIGDPAWVYNPRKPKDLLNAYLDAPADNTVDSQVQYYRVSARICKMMSYHSINKC
jgi:hypothetical protein